MPSTTELESNLPPQQQQQPGPQTERGNASIPDESISNRLPIKTYHCRFCSHLLLATTRHLDTLPRRRGDDTADGQTLTAADNKDGIEGASGGIDRAIILPLPVKKSMDTMNRGHDGDDDNGNDDHDSDEHDDDHDQELEQQEQQEQQRGQVQDNKNTPKIDHVTILLSTILPNPSKSLIRRADGFEKRLFLRCGRCRVVMGYFLNAVHFPDWAPKAGTDHGGGDGESEDVKVVYILPGALVETGVLADGDEGRMGARDGEWRGWLQ